MGLLHRFYTRNAPQIWETETRILYKLGLARPPAAAQWMVTASCNLHCPHCYSSAGKREPNELTTDEAKHLLIDELVKLGKPTLVFAGGELFLRKDIPELIRYAAKQGLEWAMHSHGGFIAKHRDLLAEVPPKMAAISLDGPETFHDEFRGRKGSFKDALTAIEVLKEIGCKEVIAGTTVTRLNADMVADIYPIVAASKADSWGLHLFAPEGRGAEHQMLFPTPHQLQRVASFARRKRVLFHVELCNEWGGAGRDDLYYRDEPFLCGAGRITFVIGPQGHMLPCTTTDLTESEGNIRQEPLRKLWIQKFQRFREPGHGACSAGNECWLQARNQNPCSEIAFGPKLLEAQ
jgi:radical SAM protein with 4Fe4S-binding SPASM domain